MSADWEPACTKGFLSAAIFTARRLEEQGVTPKRAFLIVVMPDNSEPFSMWSPSLDSVASFVKEMEPRTLECHCAGRADGEDADEIIRFLRRGQRTH